MNTPLWQRNAEREKDSQVFLCDVYDVEKFVQVSPGYTYTFRKKEGEKTLRISYIRIQELAKGVFLADVFQFDNTFNSGHKGISVKLTEKGGRINLVDEFNAEQYAFSFTSGVYDLEGLNRVYWDKSTGMESFGITGAGIYKPIFKLLENTFKGKI